MSDDWRIRAVLGDRRDARELAHKLEAPELEHELEGGFGNRVIVSVDGSELFAYAGSREQAQQTETVIRAIGSQHGWAVDVDLSRWHPDAEQWEDPESPLPATDAERAAEHEQLLAQERSEATERGYPAYEVRVSCATHADTVKLAKVLRGLSIPVVQRWRYVLIGAADEDAAKALALRVTQEAPPTSEVAVEATLPTIAAETPPNPFAVFGGLGG